MARCCLSVGPGNKKDHLACRLLVCVFFLLCEVSKRVFEVFFLQLAQICWVKRAAHVMVLTPYGSRLINSRIYELAFSCSRADKLMTLGSAAFGGV
jgi:hypothetical protein